MEKKKEQLGDTSSKKLGRQEEQLKTNSRDLNTVKMKSAVAIGLTFTALMGMFNTMWVGVVRGVASRDFFNKTVILYKKGETKLLFTRKN